MLEREEVLKKLNSAYSQKWDSTKTVRCPRLKTLANIINQFVDGYTAKVRGSYHTSSTRTGRYCIDGATCSATILTIRGNDGHIIRHNSCLLYTSPSPRD